MFVPLLGTPEKLVNEALLSWLPETAQTCKNRCPNSIFVFHMPHSVCVASLSIVSPTEKPEGAGNGNH